MILHTRAETLSIKLVKLLQTLLNRLRERSTKLLNRESTKLTDLAEIERIAPKLSGELLKKCTKHRSGCFEI